MKNKKTKYYGDIPILKVSRKEFLSEIHLNNGYSYIEKNEHADILYKEFSGVSFSTALNALKNGKRIKHSCWDERYFLRLKDVSLINNQEVFGFKPTRIDYLTVRVGEFVETQKMQYTSSLMKLLQATSSIPNNYIYVVSNFGEVPWRPSMDELLSDEWIVLD